MINNKYMNKIMWIKTPKCEGSSIIKILNETDVEKVRWGYVKQRIDKNGTEIFNAAYKFAFVRNPYDRLVSSYCYSVKYGWFSGNFKQFVKTPLHNLKKRLVNIPSSHITPIFR